MNAAERAKTLYDEINQRVAIQCAAIEQYKGTEIWVDVPSVIGRPAFQLGLSTCYQALSGQPDHAPGWHVQVRRSIADGKRRLTEESGEVRAIAAEFLPFLLRRLERATSEKNATLMMLITEARLAANAPEEVAASPSPASGERAKGVGAAPTKGDEAC